ncbi:ribosomal protein S18 acetylase RimI-like enzyme [Crossiella equi]|uniref:Ribosomal protein S18 acetylase RimI-like enzyme n=1 Tax=Crossiella equi TaxID=130796 RepID=A0ABS5AKQ3_9PSEU|nr:GNAT family N-acetyltransferase [Crossiella equi]MBP2477148.1 ribosomal protein S18 acetylase RimI-like enzyme [Crossiella equi]
MPILDAELTTRPLTVADAPGWAALMAAAIENDGWGERLSAEELAEELTQPGFDAATASLGVFDGDLLVAAATVHDKPTTLPTRLYRTDADVHPAYRRRGIGTRLLRWQREHLARLHAEATDGLPAEVGYTRNDRDTGREVLYAAAGFRPVRWFFDMECDLTTPPPAAPVPDGLHLVPMTPDQDEATRLAYVETFGDHYGSPDASPEFWQHHFVGASLFRRELSFLLLAGEEIAGYVLSFAGTSDLASDGTPRVWLGDIGVRRPWRRRGAAAAMIAHAMRLYAAAGYTRAALGVDADNPTGALGVYQRAGFHVTQRWTKSVERLPAAPRPSQG